MPSTPAEALAFLHSRSPSTVVLGLERMRAALEELGHPERLVPAVHVAGTNGKGSTCAMVDAVLQAAGVLSLAPYGTGPFAENTVPVPEVSVSVCAPSTVLARSILPLLLPLALTSPV